MYKTKRKSKTKTAKNIYFFFNFFTVSYSCWYLENKSGYVTVSNVFSIERYQSFSVLTNLEDCGTDCFYFSILVDSFARCFGFRSFFPFEVLLYVQHSLCLFCGFVFSKLFFGYFCFDVRSINRNSEFTLKMN